MRCTGCTLFSFCLYSEYVCWKPVICTFFYFLSFISSSCWFLWCLASRALLEQSVSRSEHVVVFSFVIPRVLWTSWGRYRMEGDQQRESEPANRLRVQVLDISCFHRVPWVYLGPRPGEKAQHECQVIFHKPKMLFAQTSMYFLNNSLVTPFWHRASFHSL